MSVRPCSGSHLCVYAIFDCLVSDWADSKTTGIGYNIGWHHSRRFGGCSAIGPLLLSSAAGGDCSDSAMSSSGAMGSSVQFDVTPFYPFHELFSKLSTARGSTAVFEGGKNAAPQDSRRPVARNSSLLSCDSNVCRESSREDDEMMEDSKALLLEPPLHS